MWQSCDMLLYWTQGQAQECFVEKSLKGVGRVKNNTVAKLAARVSALRLYHASVSSLSLSTLHQVSEYYNQCLRPLETEPCNIIAKKNKDWPKLLKMKTLYFQAISHVSCDKDWCIQISHLSFFTCAVLPRSPHWGDWQTRRGNCLVPVLSPETLCCR